MKKSGKPASSPEPPTPPSQRSLAMTSLARTSHCSLIVGFCEILAAIVAGFHQTAASLRVACRSRERVLRATPRRGASRYHKRASPAEESCLLAAQRTGRIRSRLRTTGTMPTRRLRRPGPHPLTAILGPRLGCRVSCPFVRISVGWSCAHGGTLTASGGLGAPLDARQTRRSFSARGLRDACVGRSSVETPDVGTAEAHEGFGSVAAVDRSA